MGLLEYCKHLFSSPCPHTETRHTERIHTKPPSHLDETSHPSFQRIKAETEHCMDCGKILSHSSETTHVLEMEPYKEWVKSK